jgi:cytochrome c
MRGNQLWRCACIALLAVTIPILAKADPSGSGTTTNPLFRLAADASRGTGLFQSRCGTCHTLQDGGPNKLGPNLHALFGRKAGSLPGYNYSPAMRAAGIVWNAQTLDAYITDPHKDIPGDKMPFAGLPNKADRDDLISYLEQATR